MCFDHIHPLQHFPDLPPFLIHQLWSYKKKSRPICSPQIFLDVGHSTGDGLTYQALLVEKTDFLSLSWCQLSIAPPLRVGFQVQLPSPCWDLVRLGLAQVLCIPSQLLGAHICNCSALLRKHCFLIVTHHLWLLLFPPPFHNRDEERGDRRVP